MKIFSFLIFVFAFLLFPFSSTAEGRKIKVGLFLPLSGPIAEYGFALKTGVEIFQKKHPQLAEKFEILIEDSRYEARTAISVFRKFTEIDNVDVVYVWGSTPSGAVAPLLLKTEVAGFLLSVGRDLNKGSTNTFYFSPSAETYSEPLVRYISHSKFSKIGVVLTEMEYTRKLFDGLKKSLGEGVDISVIDSFDFSAGDFKSTLGKISRGNYDAIGVFLSSGQIANFYQQRASLRISGPSFGTDFFESRKEAKDARGAMEGAYYSSPYFDLSFADEYERQYSKDVHISWVANSYDYMSFLSQAAEVLGPNPTKEEVVQALRGVGEFSGVSGSYVARTMKNGSRELLYPAVLRRIGKNGPELEPIEFK